jgi:hypothetical protein
LAETKLNLPDADTGKAGNKKRLYILLAVLGIVSVIAVIVNFSLFKARQADSPVAQTGEIPPGVTDELAEVLPQLERIESVLGSPEKETPPVGIDPFALPIELQGIVTGGPGEDLAIIKARQTTYIVGPGDKIAGDWEVAAINRNSVQLNREEKEIVLELAPRD